MRRSVLVLVGVLGLGLAQCGPTPTPIPTPTSTPTRPAPTETPTPTVRPTATPVVWQATREEYHPMAVGNYWVYELVEEWVSGETVSGATRAEVTEIGLAITWTPEREFPAYLVREGPYGEWMQVSSEAVWSIASVYESDVTRFFLQPVRQYEFPLAIGERFERDQYYYGSEQCWVETLERVTVAAGVFEDCLRIRCGHFIEWLAPGVGLVKEVFEDRYATWGVGSSNKELVEYGIELSPAPYQPRPVTDTWWDLEGILFVEEVYDGDTISVEHGTFQQSSVDKVRYIGIDSPELDEPCGVEAKRANEQLLSQRGYGGLGYGELRMEKDVSDRDKYGRLLRYVYIDSPICPGGLCMVNYELVWHGWARAVEYPPDTAFADEFAEAEREARMYRRGCWGISPLPPGWE